MLVVVIISIVGSLRRGAFLVFKVFVKFLFKFFLYRNLIIFITMFMRKLRYREVKKFIKVMEVVSVGVVLNSYFVLVCF